MKKKIIFLFLVFILSASVVFAQGTAKKGIDVDQDDKGDGQRQGQDQADEPIQGDDGAKGLIIAPVTGDEPAQQQTRARNTEQLQVMIQEKNQEINQELHKI